MQTIDFNSYPYKLDNLNYPFSITGFYLDAYSPDPKVYHSHYEYDSREKILIINNRDQLYELIRDLSHKLTTRITSRFTRNLGTPNDDETDDISNTIDLLSLLSQIDSTTI